ncbi:MAG TPA: hypothetical protein VHD61_09705 [Lacunisphaera sp.]|nr:hypothetical protein [Lacunisphaera sp.]
MNQFEGMLLLAGLPAGMIVAGYWLAAQLREATPLARMSVAPLAGLASLLLAVSVVNAFAPLNFAWGLACLAPLWCSLAWPRSRRALAADAATLLREPMAPWLFVTGAAFLGCLVWPMLADGQRLFYDGTSNHDSFFWVAAAEYLKRHTYLDMPARNILHPMTNPAMAITSLTPAWGRMGAEGLLALASALTFTSPIKLFVYATAALYVPWIAATSLAVRTFFSATLTRSMQVVLVALQPLFVFFHANANLPNLLGVLSGTAAVIATAEYLREGAAPGRPVLGWWLLIVLGLHGLFCSYPEMIPFVLLPCGLLWLRGWIFRADAAERPASLRCVAALFIAVAINPATSLRAEHGFIESFNAARADAGWSNLFATLLPSEYPAGLTTLSVTAAHFIGPWPAAAVGAILGLGLVLTWWRARDRFGAAVVFAGGAALAAYTLATGFSYGWQKTSQFCGVFVAAAVPVAVGESLLGAAKAGGVRRIGLVAGLGVVLAFQVFALHIEFREVRRWAANKSLSQDWFKVRAAAQGELRNAPVLVETATFGMGFFHSMWSSYFLYESDLYFGARGEEAGGYLHDNSAHEGKAPLPPVRAVLVGRSWADTVDANSPRMAEGREYALLAKCNRVTALEGVFPSTGLPEVAGNRIALTIVPHSPATLVLRLGPQGRRGPTSAQWQVRRTAGGTNDFSARVSGPAPWEIRVPLAAGRPNAIAIENAPAAGGAGDFPFAVEALRVEGTP